MKKIVGSFLVFLLMFLGGCQKKESIITEILKEVEFNFKEGDSFLNVTNDFEIIKESVTYPEAIFFWDSSDPKSASIANNKIKITRPKEDDLELTLYLTIFYQGESLFKDYHFIIKADDSDVIGEPIIPSKKYYRLTFKSEEEIFLRERIEAGETKDLTGVIPPLKEGYLFAGWLLNEELVTEVKVTKNTTLRALFNQELLTKDDEDETAVLNDLFDLWVADYYLEKTKLNWPLKGLRGSDFSYQLKNEIDETYLDLTKMTINPPLNEFTTVTLVVTASKAGFSESKEIILSLGEPELILSEEIAFLEEGAIFKIAGVISGFYQDDESYHYFFKDESGAFLLTTESYYGLPAFYEVELILRIYQNEPLIITSKVGDFKRVEPLIVADEELLKNSVNEYLYLEGIVTKEALNKESLLYVGNNNYQMIIKDTKSKPLFSGDYLSLKGYLIKKEEELIIIVTDSESIKTFPLSNAEISDIIATSLDFKEAVIKLSQLPVLATFDPVFKSEISWSTSDGVVIEEGEFLIPENLREFNLTATIRISKHQKMTKTFLVIVDD